MSSTAKVQAIPTLVDVAQVFPKRRLLVVGDFVADHYIYGETDRVSREAPVLVVRYESSEVKLGGAANAAANVRSLGGQVMAVGILGQDNPGQALRNQFRSLGIRLFAVSSPEVETQTKTRILAGGLKPPASRCCGWIAELGPRRPSGSGKWQSSWRKQPSAPTRWWCQIMAPERSAK